MAQKPYKNSNKVERLTITYNAFITIACIIIHLKVQSLETTSKRKDDEKFNILGFFPVLVPS